MTKRTTAKKDAPKKAAVKNTKKTPPKAAAPSKAKSVVKKPVKPMAKASKPVEKKAVAKSAAAPDKSSEKSKDVKKVVPPKKEEPKKAAPVATNKSSGAKNLQEKVALGTKKSDFSATKAGAVAGSAKQAPIKVEPKIIEAPQPEFTPRPVDQELFTREELDHFRELLQSERGKILTKARKAMEEGNIAIDRNELFDEVDQAAAMIDQNLTFRLLDRDRKLLSEIDHALAKIESGDYGYCEGTGEAIPKRRLELRPWCRHSVKYKEKLERMKKSGRGVVDEDEL